MKGATVISFSNLIMWKEDDGYTLSLDVGTYDGNTYCFNDFCERAVDLMWEYLRENNDPMLEIPEVKESPYLIAEAVENVDSRVYREFEKKMIDWAEKNVKPVIEKKFLKWGIKIGKFSYNRPREYNFRTDELDLEIRCDLSREEFLKNKEKLRPQIEHYINDIRRKSCSGYWSFEPDNFDEVGAEDYAYLWAILTKEMMIEDIKELFIDDMYADLSDWIVWELYEGYLDELEKGTKARVWGAEEEKYIKLKLTPVERS